ncbi:hypothetical protein CBS101457_001320 [Exobasidium rhododendri]|nr:hypothetical protein CBS101457_001320 [Exobasidium rhododendri]
MLLLCLVRTATYVVRAVISSVDDVSAGTATAAGILIIAGYLFLLEAVCNVVTFWMFHKSKSNVSTFMFPLQLAQHAVLSAVSVIGIIGAVQLSHASTNSEASSAKDLRLASAVLFVVVVGLVGLTIVVVTILRRMRQQGTVQGVVWILVFFVACTAVESAYRVWSSVASSSFIVKETAIDVLIFMPEVIACLTWLLIDLNDINRIRWVLNNKKQWSSKTSTPIAKADERQDSNGSAIVLSLSQETSKECV